MAVKTKMFSLCLIFNDTSTTPPQPTSDHSPLVAELAAFTHTP